MAYTPQTWTNGDPTTPINATRLAYIESGVSYANNGLDTEVARATAGEAAIQAQLTALGSPVAPTVSDAALLVNDAGNAWTQTLISAKNLSTTAGLLDNQMLPGVPNIYQLGWLAGSGDPAFAGVATALTTGVMSFVRVYVPYTISPTKMSIAVSVAGGTLTSIATATVTGSQTAPSSGSWSLTTSTPSGYASSGIATIGTSVVAYSAWSGTTMTVQAGGYTPGTVFSGGATITANLNALALYTSSGTYIAGTIDQPGASAWTATGQKQGTLFPTPTITGGAGVYVWAGAQSTGTTPVTVRGFSATDAAVNAGPNGLLSGANRRSGTQGTYVTGMPNAFTPGSLASTSTIGNYWVGLS